MSIDHYLIIIIDAVVIFGVFILMGSKGII